uniref:INCENP_ARK-bind domain-containing protein n=1 Tax=Ascaris lumbricoides TaxID=6252 RepID=A0A0M3HTY7_ASCLU
MAQQLREQEQSFRHIRFGDMKPSDAPRRKREWSYFPSISYDLGGRYPYPLMKEDKRKGRGFRWANDEAFDRDFDMDEYDKRPEHDLSEPDDPIFFQSGISDRVIFRGRPSN